ncbi:glycosyltransferase family 2 protein [Pedobacter sp. N23S346]|uniref:glycosyltransferase family 2 protein n=1 Tax=Pedobacter sp. N23S346 TaxID=3402750 RepID=UPI003AD6EBB0
MEYSKVKDLVYIVIPVFNRISYTINCLRSLDNQDTSGFRIVVVDHGSTDGTAAIIKENFPQVIVLQGNENMWWTAATNLGVKYALSQQAAYILTLNNDLEVCWDYISSLLKVASIHPKTIIGSISVDIADLQKVIFAGTSYNLWTASYKSKVNLSLRYDDLRQAYQTIKTDLLPGRGTLIPAEVFYDIGLFDQKNFPHYAADEDFSLRARKHGYSLIISTEALVYSYVQETGLAFERFSLPYLIKIFSSIKSPRNLKIRWRWALRHSKTPAPLYFMIDFARMVAGIVF